MQPKDTAGNIQSMVPTNIRPEAVEAAHAWLVDHEEDLIRDLRLMLQIPSLEDDASPNAPFGMECRRALDVALALGESWGMRTRDVEGFAGHAEFGEGNAMVMSLGHLDVVPVSNEWKHEPFGAEIDGEFIYSRGAIDDKGPTLAAFYAARALKETGADLGCRIRIVFGCNEESGFKCVERYFQVEEAPTFGIAPDSMYPCVYAEKGIANLHVAVPFPKGDLTLVSISGGQRPNIVVDSVAIELDVSAELSTEVHDKVEEYWDKNISFKWSGNRLHAIAKGKAAHGSRPFLGDSAVVRVLRAAFEFAPPSQKEEYENLMEIGQPSGTGLGIHGRDDVSEDLTANIGIVSSGDGQALFTVNVRYPVTWKGAHLRQLCESFLAQQRPSWSLQTFDDSPSLYFPKNEEPVRTILRVVEAETGKAGEPGVMGGGTYARAVPNTVSVGTGWEGDGPAHENDERIHISHPLKMAKIYAHMLFALAQEARK